MGRRLEDAPWSHGARAGGAWSSSQHPQGRLPLGAIAARRILLRGNRLQMKWVDAGMIAAEVVDHQARRNRSSVQLVVVAVGRDLLAVTALQSIAVNAEIALPDPAARDWIDPVVDRREAFNKLARVALARNGETSPTLALRLAISSALALPARTSSAYPNGIGLIKWVAPYTMGLRLPASSDRVPSKGILSRRDRLQVRRVHTGGIPTKVVQMQAGWDRAAVALVVHPVRATHVLAVAHFAVTTVGLASLPNPAVCFVVNDVVNWGEPSGSLVVTIDVADGFTLDVPIFLCSLLGKRSRQATTAVAVAPIDLAIEITAH